MLNPYTKAAAKHLLPFATSIEVVREFKNCIQVTYWARKKRTSTFLSKKAFINFNLELRRNGANQIEVREVHGGEYVVYSHNSSTFYTVRPNHPDVRRRCECGDCHFWGAVCKHQIAAGKYREKAKSLLMPTGFGFKSLTPDIKPGEVYYQKHRVQVWKLASSYWSTIGHFLLVDTQLNAIVATGGGNSANAWYSIDDKRKKYMNLLGQVDTAFAPTLVQIKPYKWTVYLNNTPKGDFYYDDWQTENPWLAVIGEQASWHKTKDEAHAAVLGRQLAA